MHNAWLRVSRIMDNYLLDKECQTDEREFDKDELKELEQDKQALAFLNSFFQHRRNAQIDL